MSMWGKCKCVRVRARLGVDWELSESWEDGREGNALPVPVEDVFVEHRETRHQDGRDGHHLA